MPAPVPVPMIAAKTTGAPVPAPSVASDNARQFASLAIATGCPSSASRSRCSGRPFRHCEFEFFISPPAVRVPGVPMPMDSGACPAARAASTSARIASRVAS